MSDGRTAEDVVRMAIYTIDRVLETPNAQENGVVVFHDLTGLVRNNLDVRIPKMLLRALIGHFPIRIHGIYVYNAPGFFRGIFRMMSLIMPAKLKQRTHFVDSLEQVYEIIDKEEMLEEHGGTRTHDANEWVAKQMEREEKGVLESLGDCVQVDSSGD